MAAPERVEQLVENFARNREQYRRPDYNETLVRVNFINPLFEALGWDVRNQRGDAPSEMEVIHEDAVKVGKAHKAPDYGFYANQERKFFVEAKKPSVNLRENPMPAFQLRRYAWSAKLAVSVLSDFEEFAIYDARYQPHLNDSTAVARTLHLRYEQYVDKWDDIYGLFSKEAVLDGAIELRFPKDKVPRGTATVDRAFLSEIERWRELLARNIALRNPNLSGRELNFAVQMTVDRIIFLRMAEDRGIEEYKRLAGIAAGEGVYARLRDLFRQADERYNSGLFHFTEERGRPEDPDTLTPRLAIDDETLREIFRSLYYPQSPYEFSVLPVDVLGQVYEQFLGKVITVPRPGRVEIEEKPEVRKAGGVYYTPTYIVDYIVAQTVGKLLEGRTARQARSITIVDPACGSGSFLLGAYGFLLDWYRDWYVADGPSKHSKELAQLAGGEWRLTTSERKRIMTDHIHGVDIDPQAVEVTKLSLMLKLLEGESDQTLTRQLQFAYRERVLPDMGANIKCGNSLIGPDFYDNQQMSLLPEADHYRINVFDWRAGFPEIMKRGGFDAVIGNPPYIQLSMQQYYSKPVAQYLSSVMSSSMGRMNTFGMFIERGLTDIVRPNGMLSYIVPNTILTQGYYAELRRLLLERTVETIRAYEYHAFVGAVVEAAVIVVINSVAPSDHEVFIDVFDAPQHLARETSVKQAVFDSTFENAFTINADDTLFALQRSVDGTWPRFGDRLNINQAIALKGDRSESLHPERLADNFYPVVDGRDIGRFSTSWPGTYLEYRLERIHSCKRKDIFERDEKIFFRRVGEGLIGTIDRAQIFALNTLVVITPKPQVGESIPYVLGLFNSKLMNYYYRTFLKSNKRTFSEIQARQVGQLPFRTIDFGNPADVARHDQMVELVNHMLALHEQRQAARTALDTRILTNQIEATDRQIERLVYALYGLTDDEVQIVEAATAR